MNLRSMTLALSLSLLTVGAMAQSPPAAPASSPGMIKPLPPARTAEEKRDDSTMPGELRPENPVIPQLKVPLGRNPAVADSASAPRRDGRSSNGSGVDDSVARCRAQSSAAARARCDDRLDAPTPTPLR